MPGVSHEIKLEPGRMRPVFPRRSMRLSIAGAGLGIGILFAASVLVAQSSSSGARAEEQTPPPVPQVTTTVVVHGDVRDNYLPEIVSARTLDGAQLSEVPLSATVVTRDLLSDQAARVLSDVMKNDASVGEDYAPVGY